MDQVTRFACDMSALSPEERVTHSRVVRELFGTVETVDPLPGGYAFRLPATPESLRRTAEFLALERLCCPFLGFTVELPAAAATLRLAVTGPEGVQSLIRAEFGAVLPPGVAFPPAGQPAVRG